ncbi:hypothetical protein MMC25_000459 [Agyrium rufum]|nr:hypothetical protein [Agyrium rufum]
MLSLSRTTSRESGASAGKTLTAANAVPVFHDPPGSNEDPSAQISVDTIDEDHEISRPSLVGSSRMKPRTSSHSLLTSSSHDPISRKGRSIEPNIVTGSASTDRASISMPPPSSKPRSIPPNSRRSSNAFSATEEQTHARSVASDGHITGEELAMDGDSEKTPQNGLEPRGKSGSYASLQLPESTFRNPRVSGPDTESNRISLSSMMSIGSAMHSVPVAGSSVAPSATSSNAGSVKGGPTESTGIYPSSPPSTSPNFVKPDTTSTFTTAMDPVSVTTLSHASGTKVPTGSFSSEHTNSSAKERRANLKSAAPKNVPRRSRSITKQRDGASTAGSSASPSNAERGRPPSLGRIGVCALDVKARSKPSRNILTRLQNQGEFDVVVFGDKVILDEEVENWPLCDFLISFFSDGFPLEKAIAYAKLRKPFCVNDLPMQKVLWDRRICLRILDNMSVPTPRRLEVNRDGGPKLESSELARHVYQMSGVSLEGPDDGTGGGLPKTKEVSLIDDGDTLLVDGVTMKKPFVEKPTSGEDHNICIYFPKSYDGGGGRRLFRKIGNKSSERDYDMIVPRAVSEEQSSYIYEKFLHVDNAEDVKAYTVGTDFCHAETRKSPVVDGLVRRNTHGKEIRYITSLTAEEALMASKIAEGFGQRICGFDLLRAGNSSYVIDVNGWSFVKDNNEYYDKCSRILKNLFLHDKNRREGYVSASDTQREASTDPTKVHTQSSSRHRSTIKSLLRSPSLSKLGASRHKHANAENSMDLSGNTTPLTSPPSFDRRQEFNLPPSPGLTDNYSLVAPALEKHMKELSTEQATTDLPPPVVAPPPAGKHSWKLKGMVSVIRHADRTPKQKFKFTFHTQPFVDLLKGHHEEVLLKGPNALESVMQAVDIAMRDGLEDLEKLKLLKTSLARKGAWTGTKVQIKPMFRTRKPEERKSGNDVREPAVVDKNRPATPPEQFLSPSATELARTPTRSDSLAGITMSRFSAVENDLVIDKLQLIIKWGGEPTHSARYQSQDLGENMRNDLQLLNREALDDVRVFTSSERRVSTSAQIWAASFLDIKDVPENFISVRKDLLDDSNAAKDVMDRVKKKLKLLLREGHEAPPQFAWPSNMQEPYLVVRRVAELMRFHRRVMRHNFSKLSSGATASLSALQQQTSDGARSPGLTHSLAQAQAVASIQARWCCGEDAELFRERWEKHFQEFSDAEKVDPSKISELYDTMKFDSLHNRQFLEWVFTPSSSMLEEDALGEISTTSAPTNPRPEVSGTGCGRSVSGTSQTAASDKTAEKPKLAEEDRLHNEKSASSSNLAQRMGFRRRSVMAQATAPSTASTTTDTKPPSGTSSEPSAPESYFKLYRSGNSGQTKAKQDARLEKLRELYKLAKVLFDFICPQEYGISDAEKLEIGLLTSLPLLKEIVRDLEEVQASEDGAKSFIYFTKESHIYTLLNCILEGGIRSKIARNAIPELDYLSQICFELYEAEDTEYDDSASNNQQATISNGAEESAATTATTNSTAAATASSSGASTSSERFTYSIRITVTPGCHTFDPLDVVLDSKHSIGCAPRRSLTNHMPWKEVIETLRAKFHTVKLPKSFLAVNLSEEWGEGEQQQQQQQQQQEEEEEKEVEKGSDKEAKETVMEKGAVNTEESRRETVKGIDGNKDSIATEETVEEKGH